MSAPVIPAAAPPAVDLAGSGEDADPTATPSKKASKKPAPEKSADEASGEAGGAGLTNGVFKGSAAKNPYGTVQVSIKVTGGKITAADATYPVTGDSATINPPAIASLKQATVKAQSAEVDAVSGATFTSESYVKSLQAAIDAASA
ncbi:FMN-binding protein [Actinoplanes sp. NPDC049668]|uniref:FMN-binding protein n=1 Tax=unclassified Actinoplanes TaxID=2626549 RepID=UPI0033A5B69F